MLFWHFFSLFSTFFDTQNRGAKKSGKKVKKVSFFVFGNILTFFCRFWQYFDVFLSFLAIFWPPGGHFWHFFCPAERKKVSFLTLFLSRGAKKVSKQRFLNTQNVILILFWILDPNFVPKFWSNFDQISHQILNWNLDPKIWSKFGSGPKFGPKFDPKFRPNFDPKFWPQIWTQIWPKFDPKFRPNFDPKFWPQIWTQIWPKFDPKFWPNFDPKFWPKIWPQIWTPFWGPEPPFWGYPKTAPNHPKTLPSNPGKTRKSTLILTGNRSECYKGKGTPKKVVFRLSEALFKKPWFDPKIWVSGPKFGPKFDPNLTPNFDPNLTPNFDPKFWSNFDPNLTPNFDQILTPNFDPKFWSNFDPNFTQILTPNFDLKFGPLKFDQNSVPDSNLDQISIQIPTKFWIKF